MCQKTNLQSEDQSDFPHQLISTKENTVTSERIFKLQQHTIQSYPYGFRNFRFLIFYVEIYFEQKEKKNVIKAVGQHTLGNFRIVHGSRETLTDNGYTCMGDNCQKCFDLPYQQHILCNKKTLHLRSKSSSFKADPFPKGRAKCTEKQ